MPYKVIKGYNYKYGNVKGFPDLFCCVGLDGVVLGHTSMSLVEENLTIATIHCNSTLAAWLVVHLFLIYFKIIKRIWDKLLLV